MLQTVFDQAKDVHVANYLVYGNTTDNKLYYSTAEDAAQVEQAEVEDAFLKGRLVVAVDDGTDVSYYAVTKVAANKVYTLDVESSTATVTEWSAKATA